MCWSILCGIFEISTPEQDKGMNNIAICIATYKRPQGLERLLESLANLRFSNVSKALVKIIVVDNDKEASGEKIVQNMLPRIPCRVAYHVEPKRGICWARNKLVSLAGDVEFIAFIDDDEIAEAGWLDELIGAQKRFEADVVMGPVLPRFKGKPPRWIVEGKFFQVSMKPDGALIGEAFTGNVLVKTEVLGKVPGPFDIRLNLSGGEDTLLFRQIYRLGAKIVFAAKAIVEEFHPSRRMTLKWYCRRAYRIGNTNALVACYSEGPFACAQRYILTGLGRFFQGFLLLGMSLLVGQTMAVKGILSFCLGAGNLSGVFGVTYNGYKYVERK